MPRRRTIVCRYCGFLQLKRDSHCEQCGRMTRRERAEWYGRWAGVIAMLIVAGFVWWKVQTFSIP